MIQAETIPYETGRKLALFMIAFVVWFIWKMVEDNHGEESSWAKRLRWVMLVVLGAVFAESSRSLSVFIAKSPDIAVNTISNPWFTLLWLGTGVALFWTRGYLPKLYGSVEIFVGLTAVFYAINSTYTTLAPKLLALTTGIYVIVRGLDNFEKGLSGVAKDRWAKVFWKSTPS